MADPTLQDLLHTYFPFGFPASQDGWDRFGIGKLLAHEKPFTDDNVRYTVRRLADAYNRRPPAAAGPAVPIFAEQWLALGILTDALRYVALHYGVRERPGVLDRGWNFARDRVGETQVDPLPGIFLQLFPPGTVAAGRQRLDEYAGSHQQPLTMNERIAVETILLYLQVRNRATRPFRELFDDEDLQQRVGYVPFVVSLEQFLDDEEPSGVSGKTLFHTLRAPMLASPDNLDGQLHWIAEHWRGILPEELLQRLDLARDLLREMDLHRAPEYGPPPVLDFGEPGSDFWAEPVAFSRDADWMSNVVLIAKSTYVWLDQLSKRHGRHIHTLNQVPDEELDRLARWGFTGLWLIGLWERSRASARVKQYMGNPEAVASAYSLQDYAIAHDLGGEEAYRDLRERAWRRGIRLASDMVPNHMGIDSRWVIEHPDWFIQVPHPPYPAYRFTGGDLCDHSDVEVRLEEGYWNHTDAAVVFERRDSRSGETRYIYHGNDGTSMPWNDTAQLDFTRADVREAVVQTILHVARQFPIIRFDAAMTLAKKHFQRLWFPAPGDAGAIPSRAEHGATREQFDQMIPVEFWREVVDRVKAEVPETLLLAEAFWLMEGYFVRTLGMHRVYNSAFMNMLKMEENQKYRQTIKNVLEFSPEVLKRFVNFMNNPDERTAVEQFGKGDKYYGVAILMVTMPGLPMFGHGQIEGFAEKYGMEYRRAYWDETADDDMVRRHEREVFPLMKHRDLFSSAENFTFFDFVTPHGTVDENVFAYSNRAGEKRAVVLYNNAYPSTAGRIHTSTAVNVAAGDQDPHLVRRSLAEALALSGDAAVLYAYRDPLADQQFLRSGEELTRDGLYAELHGYQAQVFVDFRELRGADQTWHELYRRLAGQPVRDLERARRELELEPVLSRLGRVTSPEALRTAAEGTDRERDALATELVELIDAAAAAAGRSGRPRSREDVAAALADLATAPKVPEDSVGRDLDLTPALVDASHTVGYLERLLVWLGEAMGETAESAQPLRLTTGDLDLILDHVRPGIAAALDEAVSVEIALAVVRVLSRHPELLVEEGAAPWRHMLDDPDARAYLQSNRYRGVWYLAKEPLENLLKLALPVVLRRSAATRLLAADIVDRTLTARDAAAAAGYREEIFLSRLADDGAISPPREHTAKRRPAKRKAKMKPKAKDNDEGEA